jgi:hypothetical protein
MAKSKAVVDEITDQPTTDKLHFEEWEVKITNNKAEKLKVARPKVKITEDHAAILNHGYLYGNNTWAKLFYLPNTDEPVLPNF